MVIGSLADLIRSHARRRPDAPALTAGAQRLTFADLDRRSNQVGAALVAAGVAPGDRVAYLGKNTLAFFELLFGASKAGAVTVPVNWRLAPAEIADILDDSTAAVLVVGPEFAATVESVVARLPAMRHVLTLDQAAFPGGEPFERWSDVAAPDDPGHQPAADDVALQLYTSGTTGRPKGAMLTNRNVWNMLPATSRDWGFGEASVNLVALPNFHVGGVGWALVGLYVGASSVVLPEFAVDAVLARDLRAPRHARRAGARRAARPAGARSATRGSTSARWRRWCTAPRRSPRACSPRRCARSRAPSSRGTG